MRADRPALAPLPAPASSFGMYEICVVCLGNICRSPMAEVLIKSELADAGLAGQVSVESAGTGDWHLGEPMDRRARAELTRRGYDGSAHRARQIGPGWLDRFDLLLAMDQANLRTLRRMAARSTAPADAVPAATGAGDRIRLFRSFDPDAQEGAEVPDPYGGSPEEFAAVFDLMRAAARGLV